MGNLFKFLIIIVIFLGFTQQSGAENLKQADLAGTWYPADPHSLRNTINRYISNADIPDIRGEIIALISPHAGLIYSGQTAAFAFRAVKDLKVNTAVIVGFSHRLSFEGAALFSADGYRTPLGPLYTDKELNQKIISSGPRIFSNNQVFESENSIELILPFVQAVLGSPRVVLLAMGDQTWESSLWLGEVLYESLKDEENILLIASTDLSHYLPFSIAEKTDLSTISRLQDLDPEELFSECRHDNRMCGLGAVTSVMVAAKKMGADKLLVLDRADSSEATGDKNKVVGYLSAVFVNSGLNKRESVMEGFLNENQKNELLRIARETIEKYLREGKVLEVEAKYQVLKKDMGVFVTLHENGELRGCIGNIIGRKPLYLGVRDMAIASATEDPRFPALKESELPDVEIEISVLSPLEKVDDPEEIVMGTHGVLVRQGFRSGVYLPQVAVDTGWDRERFMSSLCAHKAGLEPGAWKEGKCEIYIFTAEVFCEKQL